MVRVNGKIHLTRLAADGEIAARLVAALAAGADARGAEFGGWIGAGVEPGCGGQRAIVHGDACARGGGLDTHDDG